MFYRNVFFVCLSPELVLFSADRTERQDDESKAIPLGVEWEWSWGAAAAWKMTFLVAARPFVLLSLLSHPSQKRNEKKMNQNPNKIIYCLVESGDSFIQSSLEERVLISIIAFAFTLLATTSSRRDFCRVCYPIFSFSRVFSPKKRYWLHFFLIFFLFVPCFSTNARV